MAERVEKIIAGAFIADIEDIKRDIKRINIQMKSFADNMETLLLLKLRHCKLLLLLKII